MATKFCLSKFSMFVLLVSRQVFCDLIKVKPFPLPIPDNLSNYQFKGGVISYGSNPAPFDPSETRFIGSPDFICILKDHSLELKEEFSMAADIIFEFMISYDFGKFESLSSSPENTELAKGPKLCFLFGYYWPYEYTEHKVRYIYLNFLSDKLSIERSDLLFIFITVDTENYDIKLTQQEESKSGAKSSPWYNCKGKSKDEKVEFSLNEQSFSLPLNGMFNMVFVNNVNVTKKRTDNRLKDASLTCTSNTLTIIYSNQEATPQEQLSENNSLTQSQENILLIV